MMHDHHAIGSLLTQEESIVSKKLEMPYNAIIPYAIQADKTLSPSSKIFFGQITGLAIRCGYIWATDEQLAEMSEESLRNIQRWLSDLESKGYITREVQQEPVRQADGSFDWRKKRKIYVSEAFCRKRDSGCVLGEPAKNGGPSQVLLAEPAKNGGFIEPAKNGGFIEPAKNGGYNSTSLDSKDNHHPGVVVGLLDLSNQEQAAPARCPPPSEAPITDAIAVPAIDWAGLNLSDQEQKRLIKMAAPARLTAAAKKASAWKGRPSDIVAVVAALKAGDSWSSPSQDSAEDPLTYLDSLRHLDGQTIGHSRVTVGPGYIEFSSGQTTKTFAADDRDMVRKVKGHLVRIGNKKT